MVVIAPFQLILNYYCRSVLVFRNQIDTERALGLLLPLGVCDLTIYGLTQNLNILLKPLREIVGFMPPHFAERDALNFCYRHSLFSFGLSAAFCARL